MRPLMTAACAALSLWSAGAARAADDAVTVQSLIGQGYAVVSSFMTQIGPALFLQKADKLFLCFVRELPSAKEVTTNYCKPVH